MTYVPEYIKTSYKLIQNNQNGKHQLVKETDGQFTGETIQRLKNLFQSCQPEFKGKLRKMQVATIIKDL